MARTHKNAKKHDKNQKVTDSSLGDLLRRAREQKGLSIDEIHARTKIARSVLVALENDDTASLPAPAYVRAMARNYARVLGITDARLEPHLPSVEVDLTPRTTRKAVLDDGPMAIIDAGMASQSDEGEERGVSSMLVVFLMVVFLSLLASYIAAQEESKSSPVSPSAQEITTYDVTG